MNKGTADTSGELSTNKSQPQACITNSNTLRSHTSVLRAITHPSPKIPPRETTISENLSKSRTFGKDAVEFKTDSEPSPSESIVSASLKLSIEQARPKFIGQMKRQNLSKEHVSSLPQPCPDTIPSAETYQLSFPSLRATTIPTSLSLETCPVSIKPASCRTTSKIPTPLSRKTTKSSPTSSDSVLTSSASKTSPSKTHSMNNKPSTSQSPCPIRRPPETGIVEVPSPVSPQASSAELPPSPSSRLPPASARRHEEALLSAERRRTVVEVCEKVVVPQGKTPTTPPVTPFITVNRVNAVDKRTTSIAEVRSDLQVGNASKNS